MTAIYLIGVPVAAILYWIFRERPNGNYPPEEGVVMSGVFVGAVWPLIALGLIALFIYLGWWRIFRTKPYP